MATQVKEPLDDFKQIMEHIAQGNNFLLSGGAGSGKTYSLVQVIKRVLEIFPTKTVACMTYTNAAVREIKDRVGHSNLHVSTIHEFLWSNIKHFQKELKATLVLLVNDEECHRIKVSDHTPLSDDYFDQCDDGIQYKEFVKIGNGIISHDELLIVANKMFSSYPLLCGIVKDKYPFIFVDEYQDTQQQVVEILLDHLDKSKKTCVRGFFGDAMQSIYTGRGTVLDAYKEEGSLYEVKKEQNRRNPQLVIDLANKLRTDGLEQNPSGDLNAPNMSPEGKVKEGKIRFLFSNCENDGLNKAKAYSGWDFLDVEQTKELNLTHNLMADKVGFRTLMDIYDGDKVLAYCKRVKDYIKDSGIDEDFSGKTFHEVVDFLRPQGGKKVLPTKGMVTFFDTHSELLSIAMASDYNLISKLYVDKDQLLDDKKQDATEESKKGAKRDDLVRHLFRIQHNIYLYESAQYNEFIHMTDYRGKINSVAAKKVLKKNMKSLIEVGDKSIEDVIDEADLNGICRKDDRLAKFISSKSYLYNRVKDVKFSEFQKLYEYLEGYTPYSTQHKTKGTEFDNVLVVLDNGRWNKYNFVQLFDNSAGQTQSVLERTQKIFYVCCTRAKEDLAVYFHSPSEAVVNQAKIWFGEDNVINLDGLNG
ncbi:ATP-dependent helicase [Maridesulfovibrio frigidus]|uniref:ATP-dependent helicase n=1 Tax=Maridesulfovibrio frigidus TaxID=340956 RepID=UPI0004E20E9D|nr:ATP-dependent helicase [Maridesulfovibrio frigidus]